MAYIVRRQSVYYLNLRLPKHLFPNRHTLRMCLNLRERQTALFLASSLAQQAHNYLYEHPLTDILTLRRLCTEWRDKCPPPPSMHRSHQPGLNPAKTVRDGPALSALSKLYIEEGKRGSTWREVRRTKLNARYGICSSWWATCLHLSSTCTKPDC